MTNGQHIPEDDLALYAMGALAPEEQAAVRAHLADCSACRESLARVNEELSLLAISVEQHPLPSGARQRFLARVANEPQAETARPAAAPAPLSEPPRFSSRAHLSDEEDKPRRRSIFPILLPWAVAVAAILVAVYFRNMYATVQRQDRQNRVQIAQLLTQSERAEAIVEALTSPQAQQVTLTEGKLATQPTGHATYLASKGALIFVGNHLHKLPPNKTYQLWVIPANGKAPIPAGIFQPDANGAASVILPQLPQDVTAKAFGVTIENAEGSETPTLPIVLAGQ